MMLCALLVVFAVVSAGMTMSWFTDDANGGEAVFTAGTVEISVNDPVTDGYATINNWNPGDCGPVEWTFINKGTKAVMLRACLEGFWQLKIEDLDNWAEYSYTLDKQFNISGRGSVDAATTWDMAIRDGADAVLSQGDFAFQNGVEHSLRVKYNSNLNKVRYIVDGEEIYYTPVDSDGDTMYIMASSAVADCSIDLFDLELNGMTLDDLHADFSAGKDGVLIQGIDFSEDFELTGKSVMTWPEGAIFEPKNSQLAYYVAVCDDADFEYLSTENVSFELCNESESDWTYYDGCFYYLEPIYGTYDAPALTSLAADLCLKVCLDGPETGNEYQGESYTMLLHAEAVQESNGAPLEVWGFDPRL